VLREKRLKEKMEIDTPNRDEEESLEACAICLADLLELEDNYDTNADSTVVQLKLCSHKYHRRCLILWLQNKPSCAVCNRVYMPQVRF
jgi:hypothetical protein